MQDVMNCIEKNKVTVWNSVPAIMDMGIRYINNSKNTDYIWEQNSYEYVVIIKKCIGLRQQFGKLKIIHCM